MKKTLLKAALTMSAQLFKILATVCIFSSLAIANTGKAQSISEVEISISTNKAKLPDVFTEIEKKTQFKFVYDQAVNNSQWQITINLKSKSVEKVLEYITAQTGLLFKQNENNISVSSRSLRASSTTSSPEPIKIAGKVTDAQSGEPLPGVNIIVRESTNGTTTDANGMYSILIDKENSILVFSFIGYTTQEIPVENRVVLDIALVADTKTLGEVVVVGYGEQSKAKITSAISQVKGDLINAYSGSNFALQLTGKAAGVVINDASAQPGTDPQIVIRGLGTLTAGRNPLIVVDGFPLTEGTPFNSINPQDIESLEILKDPSSAAIYGSRAANGVILVTTKKGKGENLKISFDAYSGIQQRADKVEYADAYETALYFTEARDWAYVSKDPANRNITDDRATRVAKGASLRELRLNYLQPYLDKQPGLTNTNWLNEIYRNAKMSSYNLSFSGGSSKTKYYISANYFDQDGIVIQNGQKRYSGTIKLDSKISNKLNFGISLNPSYSNQKRIDNNGSSDWATSPLAGLNIMYPFFSPYNPDGTLAISQQIIANTPEDGALGENIVALATKIKNNRTFFRTFGNSFLSFEPIKGLKFKTLLGTDVSSSFFDFYNPSDVGTYRGAAPKPAVANETRELNTNYLIENTITFAKTFGSHNLNVLAGYTFQKESGGNTIVSGTGIPDNDIPNIGGASSFSATANRYAWTQVSYLSRIQYDYNDKYLFSATVRRDGSSRFGDDNKWATFPSVTAGWIISNESFFPESKILSFAKLRGSWGTSGNNQITNYGSEALVNSNNYVYGNTLAAGFGTTTTSNTKLSWETKTSVDVGINVGFLNKLNLGVDYYSSISSNLLLNVPIPEQSGFSSSLQNIGEIKNSGLEFELGGDNIAIGPVKWEFSANVATNKNEVLKLAAGQQQIIAGPDGNFRTKVGGPIAELYGYNVTGVYKSQDEINNSPHLLGTLIGDYKVEDRTGDGMIDLNDQIAFGGYNPKLTFGFDSKFTYKNFELSFSFMGINGRTLYDHNFANFSESGESFGLPTKYAFEHRYHPIDNPDGFLGQPNMGNYSNARRLERSSNIFYHNADYVRLRNVQLAYNIPGAVLSRLRISAARIYFTANNPVIITSYRGFNPDATTTDNLLTNGMATANYPVAKSYILGISLTF